MNKENFTDRLIKRFYGISGPLDEYKRREADPHGEYSSYLSGMVLDAWKCCSAPIGRGFSPRGCHVLSDDSGATCFYLVWLPRLC